MSFKKKTTIIVAIATIITLIIIGVIVKFVNKPLSEGGSVNEIEKQEEKPIIVDTTAPMILLDESYSVTKGFEKNLVDVILSVDDIDSNPKREIIGEYDINTVGEYSLTYKIEDASGNVTSKDFILKVKEESNNKPKEEEIKIEDAIKNYKTDSTKIGIDVSRYQEIINWEKVKNAGVEFAILRMGYQKGFDGEVLVDPYFEQNVKGCKENDIPIAVYFSSYAKTKEESRNHAKWIDENLKQMNLNNLTIAFDWENWTSFNTLSLSLKDINDIADDFMGECENLGYKSMLYGSKSYLEDIWQNSNNYPIWLANYVSKTSYDKPYILWQFCQTGIINGIKGAVDINVLYE